MREVLQTESDELRTEATFESLGVDSIFSVEIIEKLNARLPVKLRSTDLFNYPTIAALANRLVELLTDEARGQLLAEASQNGEVTSGLTTSMKPATPVVLETAKIPQAQVVEHRSPSEGLDAIAVIGVSGQFPEAANLDQFWTNLREGRDAVREVPPNRWSIDEFYNENRLAPVKSYSKWGGFLPDPASFDPLFFNISPREAEFMDPQQRVFLMEAWRALEDAGYSDQDLDSRLCGVFVGCGSSDYEHRLRESDAWAEPYAFTGNASAIVSARIAYHLNLRGPNLAVDTACSSSLVAIHLACESLRTGTSDLALAGGVTVMCTSRFHVWASRSGMLSPDGRCKAFAHGADGFVPAEGVGVLVLKRLGDALRDGDHIHAVIRGSGVNQDGKTNGITAPSGPAQTALEIGVYRRFNIDPATISYVDCHGTGTELGDPIEVDALGDAFRQFTAKKAFCAIGSVKSNIGHAIGAAGVASVIKVLLALKHRELPPTLHCDRTNEKIDFDNSPFFVNRELRAWEPAEGHVRRAAVSSFSFSGTNVHLVIEEAPAQPVAISASKPAYLVTCSAKTENALRRYAEALFRWLDSPDAGSASLEDISYTLNAGRSHLEKRAAFVVGSLVELREVLRRHGPDGESGEHVADRSSSARHLTVAELPRLRDDADAYRAGLQDLGKRYVRGEQIDWRSLHEGETRRRVSLPTYSFEERSFWYDNLKRPVTANRRDGLGPLLDGPVPSLESGGVFVKRFDPAEPVLAEHQVGGRSILPGVACLEMVRAAAGALAPGGRVDLRSVAWLRPLESPGKPFDVQVKLRREGDRIRFSVDQSGDAGPVTHAQGEVQCQADSTPGEPLELDAVRRRCPGKIDREDLYSRFAESGIIYGPWFQTVARLWLGTNEAIGELKLRGGAARELEAYELHPGLLDGALQVAASLTLVANSRRSDPPLPFSVDRVEIMNRLQERMFVHVRGRPQDGADLFLTDAQGGVCVRLSGYFTRAPKDLLSDMCFTPGWVERPLSGVDQWPAGHAWVVSAQPGLLEAALRRAHPEAEEIRLARDVGQLPGATARTLDTADPDAWGKALRNLRRPEIIYFVAGAVNGDDELGRVRLGQEQSVVCLFRLIKALQRHGWWDAALRLKVVTRNLWPLTAAQPGEPYSAALSGLVGSLSQEYPDIQTSCIDVGEATPETVKSAVAAIMQEPAHRRSIKVAWREGRRYELELWPTELPPAESSGFRPGAVYVIVGGSGGIGSTLSEHLGKVYRARIAWIGRRPLDAEIQRRARAIADRGGELIYFQADVANQKELETAFAAVQARWGKIHGVVHSALELRDCRLERMQEKDLLATLHPKVTGMALLCLAARASAAEWLMVFSSINSLFNNAGQSNYNAASVFADLYARWVERSSGLRVHVLNWGYWGSVGAVASEHYRAALANLGIGSIEPREGIEAVERVLAHQLPSLTVFKVSPSVLQQFRVAPDRRRVIHAVRPAAVCEQVTQALKTPEAARLDPPAESTRRELEALIELERFARVALVSRLHQQSVLRPRADWFRTSDFRERLRIVPRHERLVAPLLALLEDATVLQPDGDGWRVTDRLGDLTISPDGIEDAHRTFVASYPELAGHAQLLRT
ncbi:MAG: SDR family NAD(P)-dependent oxidoreductase, partial [Verrucomicrobia bacterium]|nr:SDR family NAD(P)-dependent oxidoreductase [Verrucomicrobiota bacterium]